VVLAADVWNFVLESTAGDDFSMGPGKTYVAQSIWGTVFLDYLSRYFLIPSCNINAISEAYERHLRKPQNASFPNQYLQEQGGETTDQQPPRSHQQYTWLILPQVTKSKRL
jgi:hypothetical protein